MGRLKSKNPRKLLFIISFLVTIVIIQWIVYERTKKPVSYMTDAIEGGRLA